MEGVGVLTFDEAIIPSTSTPHRWFLGMMILVRYLHFARFSGDDTRQQSAEHAGKNIFRVALRRILLRMLFIGMLGLALNFALVYLRFKIGEPLTLLSTAIGVVIWGVCSMLGI